MAAEEASRRRLAPLVGLRTVATDLMVFTGVDPEQAEAAAREGTGELRVPAPPSSGAPFGLGGSSGCPAADAGAVRWRAMLDVTVAGWAATLGLIAVLFVMD